MTGTAMEVAATDAAAMPAEITCPRCGQEASETYYGPCTACREALRAAYDGAARDVEVAAYEPKMNVTPNAVALKDD
jgi:ribosomal protein L37E